MATKLICIIGVTGNQGGSVARRFLKDPNYRVRGITRNPQSEAAKQLEDEGAEIMAADLNELSTLIPVFAGANMIFSVTNYWEPFFRPDCREAAEAQGISVRKYAYNVELQQGLNVADAAATTVNTLDPNGFIVSTLSHANKSSNGRFTECYHFDAKAEVFPDYVKEAHPELAKKMSCVQTGYFTSSYKFATDSYLKKVSLCLLYSLELPGVVKAISMSARVNIC
jgi:hypothetical protein